MGDGLTASGEALDYRETVAALSGTLPDVETGGPWERQELAEIIAAELARAGLVLVRIQREPGLVRTGHESASGWLSRGED